MKAWIEKWDAVLFLGGMLSMFLSYLVGVLTPKNSVLHACAGITMGVSFTVLTIWTCCEQSKRDVAFDRRRNRR